MARRPAVAEFSPRGKLTIWMNCATIFMARTRIAWALGLDMSNVRVIQSAVGGAFGGKGCDDNTAMICGLLAMKAGRPVRLVNTREEEFLATRPRPAMKVQARMGFKSDGTIAAKELKIVVDNGAYSAKGVAVGSVTALRHDAMYLTRHLRAELFVVHTNKVGTGAFRGFGTPDAAFAVDQMIDDAHGRGGARPRPGRSRPEKHARGRVRESARSRASQLRAEGLRPHCCRDDRLGEEAHDATAQSRGRPRIERAR
jgi:CO/xanthine dehydrogenase Mo-binding subunit